MSRPRVRWQVPGRISGQRGDSKLTRQRLDAGISDTVAVVQSQDALAIVQSDYVNSVVALNVAKLAMARVIAAALKTGLDSWLSK